MNIKPLSLLAALLLVGVLIFPISTFAQGGGGQGGNGAGQGNLFGTETQTQITGVANNIVNGFSNLVSDFFNQPVTTTGSVVGGTFNFGVNVVSGVINTAVSFVVNTVVDVGNNFGSWSNSDLGSWDPFGSPVQVDTGGSGGSPAPVTGGSAPVKPTAGSVSPKSGSSESKPTGSKGSASNPITTGGESSGGRDENDPIRGLAPVSAENNTPGADAEGN